MSLAERMLIDVCSYLAGQDNTLEKDVIPHLYYNNGYTFEDFENANICSVEDAKRIIEEYNEN